MATAAVIDVIFQGDTGKLDKSLGDVNTKTSKLGGALAGFGKAAAVGFAGATVAAGAFGVKAVMAASDLVESQGKVDAVFKDSADVVNAFADNAAQSLGATRGEALEMAGTVGNLLTALGLSSDAAAEMSTNTVQLAADLGAFNNLPTDVALEKLRAGLTGEMEPLKSLGVAFKAADVDARAMAMGLADADGQISESAKMQARYALIMEQTASAQGNFEATSGDLAGAMKRIKASIGTVVEEIGGPLMNAIAPAVDAFADALPGALETVKGVLVDVGARVSEYKPLFENVFGAVRSAVGAVSAWLGGTFAPKAESTFGKVKDAVMVVKDAFTENFGTIQEIAANVVAFYQTYVAPTLESIFDAIIAAVELSAAAWSKWGDDVVAIVRGAIDIIWPIVEGAFILIKGAFDVIANLLRGDFAGAWDAAVTAVSGAMGKMVEALGKLWDAIKEIAGLAIDKAKEIGANIVAGVKAGILEKWDAFTGWIGDQFAKLPGIGNKAIDASSPSRAFAEVGENIVSGIILGLSGIESIATFLNEGLAKAINSVDVNSFEQVARAMTAIGTVIDSILGSMAAFGEATITDVSASFRQLIKNFGGVIEEMRRISQSADKDRSLGPEFLNRWDIPNVDAVAGSIGKIAGAITAIAGAMATVREAGGFGGKIGEGLAGALQQLSDVRDVLAPFVKDAIDDLAGATMEQGVAALQFFSDAISAMTSIVGSINGTALEDAVNVNLDAFRDALVTLDDLRNIIGGERDGGPSWIASWIAAAGDLEASRTALSWFADMVSAITSIVSSVAGLRFAEPIEVVKEHFADALDRIGELKGIIESAVAEWRLMNPLMVVTAEQMESFAGWLDTVGKIINTAAGVAFDTPVTILKEQFASALDQIMSLRDIIDSSATEWALASDMMTSTREHVEEFAKWVGSIGSLIGAVAKINTEGASPLGNLDVIADNLRSLFTVMADVLADIDVRAASGAAIVARSGGAIADNLSKLTGGLDAIMSGPFFGLRANSLRGFTGAASRRGEAIKRAIQSTVTTLVDALVGLDIPADLGDKFAPLADAADAIAAAFDKLSGLTLPADLAAILDAAATLGGIGGGGAVGVGPGGSGAGGGGIIINIEPTVEAGEIHIAPTLQFNMNDRELKVVGEEGVAAYMRSLRLVAP